LRYSTSPITDTNFTSANLLSGEPTPKPANQSESYIVTGLFPRTTYYLAITATDDAGNISPLSNVISITTQSAPPPPTTGGGGGGGGGDFVPPSPPAGATITSADSQLTLNWTNPTDPDFVRVLIIRKTNSTPVSRSDGTPVYEGTAEEFTDINLDNNTTYHYALYSYDHTPNYSQPTRLSSQPSFGVETLAPLATAFTTSTLNLSKSLPPLTGPFSIGMNNNQVKILQQYLSEDPNIYQGPITGIYDKATVRAVELFQTKYNIVISGSPYATGYGLAGPATRAKLNQLYASTGQALGGGVVMDDSSLISQLQVQLRQLRLQLIQLLTLLVQKLQAELMMKIGTR